MVGGLALRVIAVAIRYASVERANVRLMLRVVADNIVKLTVTLNQAHVIQVIQITIPI